MSALYFAAVFHHGPRKPQERLVLMAMAEAADHDSGEVRMKAETIATRAGVSRATAWRCIKVLTQDGWIIATRRGERRNGAQGASVFVLNVEKLAECAGIPPRRRAARRDEKRVAQPETPSGVSECDTRCLSVRHHVVSQSETPLLTYVSSTSARARVAALSPFQRRLVLEGQSFVSADGLVKAGTAEMRAIQVALREIERGAVAEERGDG